MATNTSIQYNGASTKTERIQIRCPRTNKLMARYAGEWPAKFTQWLWCRGCHMEHEVTLEYIQEAQDARKKMW